MLRTEGGQLFSSSVVSATVIRSSRVLTNAPQLTGDWLLRNASAKLGNRLGISGNLTVRRDDCIFLLVVVVVGHDHSSSHDYDCLVLIF